MRWKKVLAVLGTVLVWLPILAMLVTSAFVTIRSGIFRMDYLMPAELAFFAIGGAVLLLSAALLVKIRQRFFAWGLGLMVALLVFSMGLAVVTGLASGAREASGWRLGLVAGLLLGYVLLVVVAAVGGISFTRGLFRRR